MKTAPRGGTGGGPPFGQGWFFLALTGGGDFSHDDGWFIAPPMSSEETPPLHFRLKPKIPLKLRSFISGLRAALRAVGLRNAPAGAVLSPPDPLRWAPAGAPVFGCAEKRKPSRGPSRRFAAHLGGPCTVLVVAKSAKLRFRLTAKTAPAPLLLLSPPDPLRWAPAGAPIKRRWGENLPVRANFAQSTGAGLNRCP